MEKTKYLYLYKHQIIDDNLNWDEQIKRVRSKINTGLMSLKRFKIFWRKSSSAVFSMVLSKVICVMVVLFGVA